MEITILHRGIRPKPQITKLFREKKINWASFRKQKKVTPDPEGAHDCNKFAIEPKKNLIEEDEIEGGCLRTWLIGSSIGELTRRTAGVRQALTLERARE